jgi:hypothetical protein
MCRVIRFGVYFNSDLMYNMSMMNRKGNEMKRGDLIKSFDFTGIDSCYMIGRVVSISDMDQTVRCEFMSRVFDNKVDKKFKTDFFVAPLNGASFLDRPEFPRLVVLG